MDLEALRQRLRHAHRPRGADVEPARQRGEGAGQGELSGEQRERLAGAESVEVLEEELLGLPSSLYPRGCRFVARRGRHFSADLVRSLLRCDPTLARYLGWNVALEGEALDELTAWMAGVLGAAYPTPGLSDRQQLWALLDALDGLVDQGKIAPGDPVLEAVRVTDEAMGPVATVVEARVAIPRESDTGCAATRPRAARWLASMRWRQGRRTTS